MKKIPLAFALVLFLSSMVNGQSTARDTVYTGIYITSIHDINFREKEYTVDFWLWLTYKNKEFDFGHNLEVPEAKTFVRSYYTADTSGEQVFMLMKLQCVMNNSWRITHFPFDRQNLQLTIENA